MIIYRKAEIEEGYSIAKLKGEVWNTTYRNIYSDKMIDNYDIEKNRITFEKIIANPKMSLYVAADEEKIIGFISCGDPYRPYLHYKQDIGLFYILKSINEKE